MIELLFVACLAREPEICEERAFQYTDRTARGCMARAIPELSKWAQTHPRWRIARWSCQPLGGARTRA
ncbi:hypothetical protein [Roseovarius sp.]|uniref:hypothetical protein n=1 Tax=Roseovarius sp. TaxID=1486281 RepID=UPI003A983470